MKGLQFTKQTSTVALIFFTVYFVYGIFYTPLVQFLVALSVGGIAYGISDSYEVATIALLAINYLFPIVFRPAEVNGYEGFVSQENPKPKPTEISGRVSSLKVQGVGSKMTEGFEDAEEVDMTISETKKKSVNSEATVAKSTPASAGADAETEMPQSQDLEKMAAMMQTMMKTMNSTGASASVGTKAKPSAPSAHDAPAAKKISEDNIPPAYQPATATETFQSSQKESVQKEAPGLFKLGQIPTDVKGGHHIDAGTTVMNAINALKPDQIKAMTMDTKQLIDTQKSLMGMLQTFQPMVHEGKQMMETFQEMFSPAMGSLNAASAAVGGSK
jgi:hypothetical protein